MGKRTQAALSLARKIKNKKARIGITGLGYVGLPLAVEFARAGFRVSGMDLDKTKITRLNRGISYVQDISSKALKPLVQKKLLRAYTDSGELKRCDVIIICVPTPLNKVKEPDISCVLEAVKNVRKFLRRGQLVILESTTYPGTTEEIVLPEIRKSGWKAGSDFFLCFSPERIDPGNRDFTLRDIPKVVGGITQACTRLGSELYGAIIDRIIPVSSPRVAEMAKLLENTFRIVNIGLVNELVSVAQKLNIDLWEAIDAAKTKPFGFMPFYPGPGIGGHCIGIDPLYLSWKAKLVGSELRFIQLASRVNSAMPGYVVERALHVLNSAGKSIRGARILIMGVSYKKDIPDIRESPALEIIKELKKLSAKVEYHDPFVSSLAFDSFSMRSRPLSPKRVGEQDLIIIVTPHSAIDYSLVAHRGKLIFDTRNALKALQKKHIFRL